MVQEQVMVKQRIKESLHTWNSIAKSFDHTRQTTWDFCTQYIKIIDKQAICADLGCGNGRHLFPLAKQCKHAIGFDISYNLLHLTHQKIVKNKLTNASVIQGDLCFLPFQSNVFNHCIYIAALHNIQKQHNRIRSLQELYRILKPKGTALVSVWSKEQDRFKQKKFTDNKGKKSGDIILYWRQHKLNIPRFYHLYEKEEFKQDLIKANFHIQKLKEISITSKKSIDNYYAIIQKKE